jgi:tRNA-dihydrouridine synthase
MEPVEQPGVKASTLAREAYFVDFALAMKEAVKVPLMVTGGFRSRAAMEEALARGAADVVGLGRPLCVEPDGAAQILAGAESLPRAENGLGLFPDWLAFLKRLPMLRAVDSFAGQYWFYAQIAAMGRTGRTAPDCSVFAAMRAVEAGNKRWLAARRKA